MANTSLRWRISFEAVHLFKAKEGKGVYAGCFGGAMEDGVKYCLDGMSNPVDMECSRNGGLDRYRYSRQNQHEVYIISTD